MFGVGGEFAYEVKLKKLIFKQTHLFAEINKLYFLKVSLLAASAKENLSDAFPFAHFVVELRPHNAWSQRGFC